MPKPLFLHRLSFFFLSDYYLNYSELLCHEPCMHECDPFGLSWTIKLEHFQNEKHMELFNWPISLDNVCGFFHSKKTMKKGGKKLSSQICILQHRVLHIMSVSFRKK